MKNCENCKFYRIVTLSRGYCHNLPPRSAATFVKEGESYHSNTPVRLELEHYLPEVRPEYPACSLFEAGEDAQ